MPTYSSIILEFETDFEIGDSFSLVSSITGFSGSEFYGADFVAARATNNEVTVGVPTATAGETTAINYEVAFDLDNVTGYTSTQLLNEVTITSTTLGENFIGLLRSLANVGIVNITYDNSVPAIDILTIETGLTRSPYYVNIPYVFAETTGFTMSVFIWSGDVTVLPSTASYTLLFVRPSVDYSELNADLSKLIREKINNIPVIDITLPTQVIDSVIDGVKWVNYNAVYADGINSIANVQGTFSAIDGFGYYAEGVNPNKPVNNVLTDCSYRKVSRGGVILFPFVNNGTITSITITSEGSEINETETITVSNQSTDYVQYICVDVSQATTDEYITITTSNGVVTTYEIVDECRFEVRTIFFKNRYGVFEDLSMFKKSTTKIEIENDMFVNNYISMGTYDTTKHQYQKINIQSKESISLNSGYISDNENVLYKQLLQSDKVYFYENSLLVPVNVMKKSLEIKTRVNDKLINYSIDFEYAYNIIQNV